VTVPALRIVRRRADPTAPATQYCDDLGLQRLGPISGHDGRDCVMLGWPEAGWDLELVRAPEPRRHSSDREDAIAICEPAADAWRMRVDALERAGFARVRAEKPYWQQHGPRFEHAEGFRWIVARRARPR
jgi:hypothetical protein